MFEDPEFECCDENLPPLLRNEGVIWLRPHEIAVYSRFLSSSHPKREEVIQKFGGGFFLAAVISLTKDPELSLKVVKNQPIDRGYFEFTFFTEDDTIVVIKIDDRLPTKNGELLYSQAPADTFWCPLLEKAFAKFRGGYQHLSIGNLEDSLRMLTGKEVYLFETEHYTPNQIHSMIKKYLNSTRILCCKMKHSDGNNGEYGRSLAISDAIHGNNGLLISLSDPKIPFDSDLSIEEFKNVIDVVFFLSPKEEEMRKEKDVSILRRIDPFGRNVYTSGLVSNQNSQNNSPCVLM
ncbi:hypothetical protein GCK72_001986 [Caenorhabditis remanei]|uniref:Calpain catalytic domain-containing protein n=1 Tax=Caenorhabditis remanei TaxID=31234 RepID=A0A6A5HQI6_CAERE|nr:hypothetical protein GCK72_001986 [Caenorhabditis remanei]KAF1770168.1 hypothetical protein GCK72_001986 [Caenorhabditis remanei]